MATKITRTLYIGLGGLGIDALLETKKKYLETFDEIPPMVGFIGIDTDKVLWKGVMSENHGEIHLDNEEYVYIGVDNPQQLYEANKDQLDWMPQSESDKLLPLKCGTSGVRSNGRFAFTANKNAIKDALKQHLNSMTNIEIEDDEHYELTSSDINVYVVFSLCGGTGSGTFINMAYLIREYYPQCNIIGYGLSPEFFNLGGDMNRNANAYATICELDYLMNCKIVENEQFKIKYFDETYIPSCPPFDEFYYFDSKNQRGEITNKVQVTEVVGSALFFSAIFSYRALYDNMEALLREGEFDIRGKRSWMSALGNSQIEYRGDLLEDLSKLCAAKKLLDELSQDGDSDMKDVAEKWFSSHPFAIDACKENMSDTLSRAQLTDISDISNPLPECEKFIDNNLPSYDDFIKNKLVEFEKQLSILIIETINQPYGITNSQKLLFALQQIIDNNLSLLKENNSKYDKEEIAVANKFRFTLDELSKQQKSFFHLHTKQLLNDVKENTKQLLHCRQNKSILCTLIDLNGRFKEIIEAQKGRVEDISQKINNLDEKIAQVEAIIKRHSPYTINLTSGFCANLLLPKLTFSEFIQKLAIPDKIYGFALMDDEDVYNSIRDCFDGLPKLYGNDINVVLDNMSSDESKSVIQIGLERAEPLVCTNLRGYLVYSSDELVLIGLNDKKQSKVIDTIDDYVSNAKKPVNYVLENNAICNNVIIHHITKFFPPFAISSIALWEKDYKNFSKNCHIDVNLQKIMTDVNYSLYPLK
jgi:hypothetical protein